MTTACIWYQSNPHSCGLMIGSEKIGFANEIWVAGAELPGSSRYSQ